MRGSVEVPVIVMSYVPAGVFVEVAIANVERADWPELGVTADGTMLTWVPGGAPVAWRFTVELKLPREVTVKE